MFAAARIDGSAGLAGEAEANRRLDFYLELDARLIRQPNPLPMLH